jgi:hypothetical protein
MPFIGKQPQTGAYSKLDAITTSATATYNLTLDSSAYYPQSANHLLVSLNGVMQAPQDSFTVSGSQITFASALTSSDNIDFIMALGDTLDIGVPSAGSVNTSQLANDAVTTAKINDGAITSAKLAGLTDSDMPAGSVLQVVSATKTDKQTITSTSMIDVTGLSVSITPSSTSSKILTIVNCHGGHDNTNYMLWNIVRNSTAVSASTSGHNYLSMMNSYVGDSVASGSAFLNLGMNFLDSPNTTSATTYKVQVLTTGGTAIVNGRTANTNGGTVSTITAMEIAG